MSSKTHRKADGPVRPAKADPWKVVNWIGIGLVVLIIGAVFYGAIFKGIRRPGRTRRAAPVAPAPAPAPAPVPTPTP